jgi:hypothetical protein
VDEKERIDNGKCSEKEKVLNLLHLPVIIAIIVDAMFSRVMRLIYFLFCQLLFSNE